MPTQATRFDNQRWDCAIEKRDGLWVRIDKKSGAAIDRIAPKPSLIEAVKASRYDMGFYHLAGELRDWGITIQVCYEESPDTTIAELYKSFGEMAQYWARLQRKSLQTKESIQRIRDDAGSDLCPALAELFGAFLYIWDQLNIEVLS